LPVLKHPQVLRELADVIMRPLLIIQGKDTEVWRKANVTPTFIKAREDYPVNYRMIRP